MSLVSSPDPPPPPRAAPTPTLLPAELAPLERLWWLWARLLPALPRPFVWGETPPPIAAARGAAAA
ncbi:GD18518 [Drosophila simulans]|uniref:GD18518 n=1 Tax=Drosophila simulans TaxID=7240 RepID=B4QYP8_DROSI|nr:GD18518 [Drosophila simulans]